MNGSFGKEEGRRERRKVKRKEKVGREEEGKKGEGGKYLKKEKATFWGVLFYLGVTPN